MKSQKIRLIYAIFISVFTIAIGLAIICVAADIYYSGKGTDVIYSSEIVGDRLQKLAIPLIFYIAAVIAGAIFPIYEVKAKGRSEASLKKQLARMPLSGEGEEYLSAERAYNKYSVIKNVAWGIAIAFAFAAGIASLCYLCDGANFNGAHVTGEIKELVKIILPLTLTAIVLFAVASTINGIAAKKQIAELRKMIKLGTGERGESATEAAGAAVGAIADNKITVWAVRGIVLIIGIVFIIVGALNGGARDVLIKAINLCQECIGLG